MVKRTKRGKKQRFFRHACMLTHEQVDFLRTTAELEGTSPSQVMRKLINQSMSDKSMVNPE